MPTRRITETNCDWAAVGALRSSLPSSFSSLASLQHDAPDWASYLNTVYGLHTLAFPLDLRSLAFFYSAERVGIPVRSARIPILGFPVTSWNTTQNVTLQQTLVRALDIRGARKAGMCGRRLWDSFRMFHPPFTPDVVSGSVWLYPYATPNAGEVRNQTHIKAGRQTWPQMPHDLTPAATAGGGGDGGAVHHHHHPTDGYPSHSKVEVFHCAEPASTRPNDYWMYAAKGSGVYFHLGRTLAARNRCELWQKVNVSQAPFGYGPPRCRHTSRVRHLYRHGAWGGTQPSHGRSAAPGLGPRLHYGDAPPAGDCPLSYFYCATDNELTKVVQLLTSEALDVLRARGFDSVQVGEAVRVRIERNARAHGTADCLDDSHATVCADCLTRLAVSDRTLPGPSSHNSRAFSRGCKAHTQRRARHVQVRDHRLAAALFVQGGRAAAQAPVARALGRCQAVPPPSGPTRGVLAWMGRGAPVQAMRRHTDRPWLP